MNQFCVVLIQAILVSSIKSVIFPFTPFSNKQTTVNTYPHEVSPEAILGCIHEHYLFYDRKIHFEALSIETFTESKRARFDSASSPKRDWNRLMTKLWRLL